MRLSDYAINDNNLLTLEDELVMFDSEISNAYLQSKNFNIEYQFNILDETLVINYVVIVLPGANDSVKSKNLIR